MKAKLLLFLKGFLGVDLTINEVCAFSQQFWDIHDYPIKKGGDGSPSHFYPYTCWHCGKQFES